jgi:glutathione S-transferase
MYTVIGKTQTRAFRVLWTLQELDQPYTHIDAAPQSDEARKWNPTGKIPALVDGDDILTDSVAIMTYLADKHGGLTFAPGTIKRAQQDALIHSLNEEFDAILWSAAKHSRLLPENLRIQGIEDTLKWEFSRSVARLADRFEGPFLMGETMTIADILAVHCLGWAFGAKFPVESEALVAYSKAMRQRPAFKAAAAS